MSIHGIMLTKIIYKGKLGTAAKLLEAIPAFTYNLKTLSTA